MKTAEDFLTAKGFSPRERIPYGQVADFLREYTRMNLLEYVRRVREAEAIEREGRWAASKLSEKLKK